MGALLLLAAVELVSNGQPRLRLDTDGSARARQAAQILQKYAVLLSGTALPETGALPALRFQTGPEAGYEIRPEGQGVVVSGRDPIRAVYHLLEGWGCRFDPERIPKVAQLSIEPRRWQPRGKLWVDRFDPALPLHGVALDGLSRIREAERAAALGYPVRVASTTFDDFLPPALFAKQPNWFALRQGRREARGNFALTNPEARAAYVANLGTWLDAHPGVAVVGIWPEVTTVWCEESVALGHADAYALLWRAVAQRFPERRFEILATGPTLSPPACKVPANVEVRLRPGRDASALQGIVGQPIEAVVQAWERRGATVVLEIDAAPDSFCGMPWPCHDAIRANARRFKAAVLRHGRPIHGRLWHDPDTPRGPPALLKRAKTVKSWGHPRDAAALFYEADRSMAFRIATNERLLAIARRDGDADAANDVFLGYRSILRDLPAAASSVYKRYRRRDMRQLLETLLPKGAVHRVGPARVRETFEQVELETDTLRLVIDRPSASVVSLQRKLRGEWSPPLCTAAFQVVSLDIKGRPVDGVVELREAGTGHLRVDLRGRLKPGGPAWRTRLDIASGSGIIRQAAEVKAGSGIAIGCLWPDKRFDRWVCPPYAAEGRFRTKGKDRSLPLPAGALVYARDGEEGLGLAARLPRGGRVILSDGLIASSTVRAMQVDWIVFAHTSELGKQ